MQILFAWTACIVVLTSYLHAPATSLSVLSGQHDLSVKEYQGKTYLLFNHNKIFKEPPNESWLDDVSFNDSIFALFAPHKQHHRDHSFQIVEKKASYILLSMPLQLDWNWTPLYLVDFTLEPFYLFTERTETLILAQPPPDCPAALLTQLRSIILLS